MTARHAIPTRVVETLIATGTLSRDGTGRTAQLRTCARCRNQTIVGDDHHRAAIQVTLDPAALDPLGEAIALLAGTPTYELWGREIEQRDQWKIRAGQPRPVLAAHNCANPPPPTPAIIAIFTPPPAPAVRAHHDVRPPF